MLTEFDGPLNIKSIGAFLIIPLGDEEVAYRVAKASIAGGMRALEITYSVPRALRIVRRLAEEHASDGLLIGVGMVIDAQSAYAAIEAGARTRSVRTCARKCALGRILGVATTNALPMVGCGAPHARGSGRRGGGAARRETGGRCVSSP